MLLKDWVTKQVQETDPQPTRVTVLKALSAASGVSYMSLQHAEHGKRFVNYSKAEDVSKATGYLVTVLELLDADPAGALSRIMNQFGWLADGKIRPLAELQAPKV